MLSQSRGILWKRRGDPEDIDIKINQEIPKEIENSPESEEKSEIVLNPTTDNTDTLISSLDLETTNPKCKFRFRKNIFINQVLLSTNDTDTDKSSSFKTGQNDWVRVVTELRCFLIKIGPIDIVGYTKFYKSLGDIILIITNLMVQIDINTKGFIDESLQKTYKGTKANINISMESIEKLKIFDSLDNRSKPNSIYIQINEKEMAKIRKELNLVKNEKSEGSIDVKENCIYLKTREELSHNYLLKLGQIFGDKFESIGVEESDILDGIIPKESKIRSYRKALKYFKSGKLTKGNYIPKSSTRIDNRANQQEPKISKNFEKRWSKNITTKGNIPQRTVDNRAKQGLKISKNFKSSTYKKISTISMCSVTIKKTKKVNKTKEFKNQQVMFTPSVQEISSFNQNSFHMVQPQILQNFQTNFAEPQVFFNLNSLQEFEQNQNFFQQPNILSFNQDYRYNGQYTQNNTSNFIPENIPYQHFPVHQMNNQIEFLNQNFVNFPPIKNNSIFENYNFQSQYNSSSNFYGNEFMPVFPMQNIYNYSESQTIMHINNSTVINDTNLIVNFENNTFQNLY